MSDEINRLPGSENTDGSLDQLIAGLSTLSPKDLKDIRDIIYPTQKKDELEDSPRTIDYLKLVSSLYRSGANSLLGTRSTRTMTRLQLYNIYDEMDEGCAYITSALDILSDDATQPDDLGNLYYIDSENSKVKNVLYNLFDSLEISSKLSKWARAIAKYGDLFIKIYGSTEKDLKGILSVDDTIYPSRVERKDYRGKLVAFKEAGASDFAEGSYCPPWDYVHFRHKGELAPMGDSEDSELVSNYGQSILKGSIKVYNQLKFVENMILLSRLTNSVRRNIFAINVGTTDPRAAFETIQNYAQLLKKDIKLDLDTQEFGSSKHTANFDEDIFIPVSDPKNDFRIESVGGDVNIAEQYDLDYIQNKLFAALKVPKAYLNYEQDLNARSTLIQLDIRYARSVAQLQKTLISGLTRIAKIHLAYIGIDPETVEFDITMPTVSAIDEEARMEQLSTRINAANDYWNLIININDTLQNAVDLKMQEIEVDMSDMSGGGGSSGGGMSSGGPEDSIDIPDVEVPEESDDIEPPSTSPIQDMKSNLVQDSKKLRSAYTALKRFYEGKEILDDEDNYGGQMNLEFLAAKLFREYLSFSEDEITKIFRRESKNPIDEAIRSKMYRLNKIGIGRLRDDSDIEYPTEFSRRIYENTTKSLLIEISKDINREEDPIDIDE